MAGRRRLLLRMVLGALALAGALGAVALAPAGAQRTQSAPTRQAQPQAPAQQQAAQPPATPFLRVEAGQHTAAVMRLSVDAGGGLLATASLDKTVRLWSPEDGTARGVLRVPIGGRGEGELFAVALTPDGRRAFAAGWTGYSWDRRISLYVFDVARGEMIGRLPNLPAAVNHIAISADGARVALALAAQGIVVLNAANGQPLFQDRNYRGPARMAVFDRTGRLAVSSADGTVRLYDAQHRKIAEAAPVANARPYGVAFSPDGALVAVGYEDQLRVDVLMAADLRIAYSPVVSGLSGEALPVVAFGHDDRGGLQLFAGGYARNAGGDFVVRRWGDFGFGRPVDVPVARDAISQLLTLPGGGVAFATHDPGWGRIAPDGTVGLAAESPSMEFRGIHRGRLAVSADGAVIEFGTRLNGANPLRFDLHERRLSPATGGRDLVAPITQAQGYALRNWDDADQPSLNNRRLVLGQGEFSRSATIVPGTGHVLLGTDTHLRLFDVNGRELANREAPGTVWGVAPSADGKLALAALGDGTLRWFDLAGPEPLAERAALFVHADGQRWVMWTPEGFFDHSDRGGNDLVGVHLNRGAGQAPEWVSFAQVYRSLYAPAILRARLLGDPAPAQARLAELGDIRGKIDNYPRVSVARVCVQGDEGCSEIQANGRARLPSGARSVEITLDITDRGLGIGAVDVFVNDRNRGRIQLANPPQAGARTRQAVVAELDPGENNVQVRVYDGGNDLFAASRAIQLQTDADLSPAAGQHQAGRLFVLAVGVDKYRNASLNLRFAGADARSFAELVRAQSAGLFRETAVRLLLDEDATTSNIVSALEAIARAAAPDDTFFLYMAGHGIRSGLDGRFLFLSHDVADLSSHQAVARQALTERNLIGALARIRARNGFLFIDTCYSGAVTLDNLANIGHETGRYMLAASSSVQEALDSYDNKNGVMAYALREAFAGRAPRDEEGIVSSLSLGEFVARRVPVLAREKRHAQEAVFKTALRELRAFPIARVAAAQGGGQPAPGR
ncbi:MAG: caspase family protein [Alphaproteobacteria bacterium]|nr:caspase family protein [Alphaproteobacteria bacterium]